MEYYPDNTVSCYTTKLADKIELEGDWEVGLAEISVPSSVENVVRGRCYYHIFMQDVFYRKVTLSPGHHKHLSSLIEDIHSEQYDQIPLERTDLLLVKFSVRGGRISMEFPDFYNKISIQFSPDLAHMLGLVENVKYSGNMTARRMPSLAGGYIHSMYVYCDILEHVAVGDTKAPLLRIVDKPHKSRGNVHQVFNPILYVPLQKKNFDTVEINIMTDVGVPIPFRLGKSFVVLEFRRAIHSYFGL